MHLRAVSPEDRACGGLEPRVATTRDACRVSSGDVLELEAHLRANPGDHAAWIVYADWLLEQGDPRAALVRQTRKLTTQEIKAWRGPIPQKLATAWSYGFVTDVELPIEPRAVSVVARMVADRAGRLVSRLVLHDENWRDGDVWDEPALEGEPGDVISAILALDLSQLRAFGITYRHVTDEQIEALASARLEIAELDLRYCAVTDAQLARLASARWFAGVRRLHLQRNAVTDATPLAGHAFERLDVRYTGLTEPLVADALSSYAPNRTLTREPPAPRERPIYLDGLSISSQRTSCFFVPRFVAKAQLSRSVARDCERVPGMPNLRKVYVDPDEWSFRSFENIVPLDSRFATPAILLAQHTELASEVHRFHVEGELPAFDQLPLYTQPLTTSARGGLRYIFHSAKLASALTEAVRRALPALKGFAHVNPVFRCNRFEPGDEPFHRHHDTPYYDAARNQISEYTLLVYLTGGTGAPALRIEDLAIDAIDPMTCFIFHQAYEHAGRAFADGRKVFLRTELVFEGKNLERDPRIAALFAKACYFTGESVRLPALAREADRAYNRVAAAHWGAPVPAEAGPLVHKQFRGVHWLANGYDFWFPRGLPLADCAALTLLDHFNCMIDGVPMRSLATSEVVLAADPDSFLAERQAAAFPILDKAMLMPAPEHRIQCCCPGHSRGFDPTVAEEIVELYTRAQRFARARLDTAPIMMLGQQIYLDPSRFVVDADKIHVLSADRLAPVNFASCWNCPSRPPNYLDIDLHVGVVQPLVPPILWEATRETHHLMFDFFRNAWAASMKQYRVPVPRIAMLEPTEVDEDENPWIAAAQHADLRPHPPASRTPFWAHYGRDSLLIRELYRDDEG